MIEIPRETLESHFDTYFRVGSVWRYRDFHFHATGKVQDKYIIVLIPCADDGLAYFILPTRNVEYCTRNAIVARNCFVIDAGNCSCFPERTAIDVSNHFTEDFSKLKRWYAESTFEKRIEYRGDVPERIFVQLKGLFLGSRDVPKKSKRQAFPTSVS